MNRSVALTSITWAFLICFCASGSFGCRHEDDPFTFAVTLAAVRSQARAGKLAQADTARLNALLEDRTVSEAERENRFDKVRDAVIDSGSVKWLLEFKRHYYGAAFSYYQLEAVWGFVEAHTSRFFSSITPAEDFGDELNNPQLAFGTRQEARNCLETLREYIEDAPDERRRQLAQQWQSSLEWLLRNYPRREE